jgi:putative endonuclease
MGNRKKAHRWGHWAEAWVAAYFLLRGYRILARRYRTPVGEIDLLLARKQLLVAVEVKARRRAPTGEEISPTQRQRIARAVEYYQLQFPAVLGYDVRMDAVWVRPWGEITHLPNAW